MNFGKKRFKLWKKKKGREAIKTLNGCVINIQSLISHIQKICLINYLGSILKIFSQNIKLVYNKTFCYKLNSLNFKD